MLGTKSVSTFAANRLNGEPVPHDLQILLENADELFELTGVRFPARKDWAPWLDTSHLTAQQRADPEISAHLRALAEVCDLIAFVAVEESGNYLGYWRGLDRLPIAGRPIVVLDADEEFDICAGSTLAEALLSRTHGQEPFEQLRQFLSSLGLPADYATPDDIAYPELDNPPDAVYRDLFQQYRCR